MEKVQHTRPVASAPASSPNSDAAPAQSWLSKEAARLFTGLTGLRFQFLPAPPRGLDWDTRALIRGCPGPGATSHPRRPLARCRECALMNLNRALESPCLGHCFRSDCGVRMFMLPVEGTTGHLGLLALRAKPRPSDGPSPELARHPSGVAGPGRNPRFHRAMLLLRQMAQTLELTNRSERLQVELERVNRAVASHEKEEEWLRQALGRKVPKIRSSPAGVSAEARAPTAIREVLDRVHRDFRKPLSLTDLAREFGMNTSYLSSVFAREVGMPFKAYLTALRLQEAQKLLRDPHRRVSEIAFAVGYASCERFRTAFRQCTGLSPGKWRDVLQSS